jgi:hypothetical protein
MTLGERILQFFKYFEVKPDKEEERAKEDELKLLLMQAGFVQEDDVQEENSRSVDGT